MCITPRFSRYIVGATVYGEIWHVNVHVNVETRRGTSLRMERVVWYGHGIVRCGTFRMFCTVWYVLYGWYGLYGTGGTVLYGVVRFVRVARMVRFVRMDE